MQFISVLLDVTKVKYPIYVIYIYIYIYIYDQAVIDSETLHIYFF